MTASTLFLQKRIHLALSIIGLLAAFYCLNIRTLDWPFGVIDSPILLAQAILYSPLDYFTSPEGYQFLSYNNFTPLVTLSWDIDYSLFGLDVRAYRFHQLFSLLATLTVLYLVMYKITGSILNVTVFSFAILNLPSTGNVLELLVNRHYIEGMLFAVLSFYCFQQHQTQLHRRWLILSVLFYAISITAKEVYIPLPGILFFLCQGQLQTKLKYIYPYAVVLSVFFGLRFYILGGAGGYSAAQDSMNVLENLPLVRNAILTVASAFFSHPMLSFSLFAVFAMLLGHNMRKLGQRKWAILIGAAGLGLPLIALLPMISMGYFFTRWVFAPAVVFLLCLSYLCSISSSKTVHALVYLIVFSGSAHAYYQKMQAPVPNYVKGNGHVYKKILASDENSYLLFSRFSELAANGHSIWVYIAKLHNGVWGTLSLSFVEQLQYHDVSHKTVQPLGRKAKVIQTENIVPASFSDVLKDSQLDTDSGLLTINMIDQLSGKHCMAYIFGEHNGLLFEIPDCAQWSIQSQELKFQLRRIGYDLDNSYLAIWTLDTDKTVYSKPYSMQSLM